MQQERAKHRVGLLGPPKKLARSNLAGKPVENKAFNF